CYLRCQVTRRPDTIRAGDADASVCGVKFGGPVNSGCVRIAAAIVKRRDIEGCVMSFSRKVGSESELKIRRWDVCLCWIVRTLLFVNSLAEVLRRLKKMGVVQPNSGTSPLAVILTALDQYPIDPGEQ